MAFKLVQKDFDESINTPVLMDAISTSESYFLLLVTW